LNKVMESMQMISVPRSLANLIASLVFPEAVGPAIIKEFSRMLISMQI
jgi:hypothetical protein